jgi:probable HAF family extracellular repeat protein
MRRIAAVLTVTIAFAVALPMWAAATRTPEVAMAAKRSGVVITDIGTLGGTTSFATAINELGWVTGGADLDGGVQHAFLWRDGAMADLGTPLGGSSSWGTGINNLVDVVGGTVTDASPFGLAATWFTGGQPAQLGTFGGTIGIANDVNDRRQVVGYAGVEGDLFPLAFTWQNGTLTSLGTLGGESSRATAVNSRGQVVGSAIGFGESGFEVDVPFLSEQGRMVDLATPPGSFSGQASDINDHGQVVGSSFDGQHAFLYRDGRFTDLGFAGTPQAISARGLIVGSFCVDPACVTVHAFAYDKGQLRDLNSLLPAGSGWELTQATDVNRRGQIVGSGMHDGVQRGFILEARHLH